MSDQSPHRTPPPPYTPAGSQGQQGLLRVDDVPDRLYLPNHDRLFHEIQVLHPEVSWPRFEAEVAESRDQWMSSMLTYRWFHSIWLPYRRDFVEFFVDCHMWNKYIHLEQSRRTAEYTRQRLVQAEADIQRLEQALADRDLEAFCAWDEYSSVLDALTDQVNQAAIAREVAEQTITSRVIALEAELRQFKKDSAAEKAQLSNKIKELEAQNDALEKKLQKQNDLLDKEVKEHPKERDTKFVYRFASIDDILAKSDSNR